MLRTSEVHLDDSTCVQPKSVKLVESFENELTTASVGGVVGFLGRGFDGNVSSRPLVVGL